MASAKILWDDEQFKAILLPHSTDKLAELVIIPRSLALEEIVKSYIAAIRELVHTK